MLGPMPGINNICQIEYSRFATKKRNGQVTWPLLIIGEIFCNFVHNRDRRGSYPDRLYNDEKGDDVWLCKVKGQCQCLRDCKVVCGHFNALVFAPVI